MWTTSSAHRTSTEALAALLLLAGVARGEVLHVPAEFPTLAEALAAAVEGDEIVLASGVYPGPIALDGLTGLTLRGQGKVIVTSDAPATDALSLTDCHEVVIDNVRIEDPQGNGVFVGQSTDITLRRLRVEGADLDGIIAGETSRCTVDRCVITGSGGHGVSILFLDDGLVTRCTITDSGGSGVSVSEEVGDATVERCRIEGTGSHGVAFGQGDPVNRVRAVGNVITGAGAAGVFSRSTDAVVLDNRITGSTGPGISLFDFSVGALVKGNRVDDCGDGIVSLLPGVLLRDNRVRRSAGAGITLGADDSVCMDNLVLQAAAEAFVIDTSVSGCDILDCRAVQAGDDGFDVRGDGNVFTGNSSLKAGAMGFRVTGALNQLLGNAAKGSGQFDLSGLAMNSFVDNDFGTIGP